MERSSCLNAAGDLEKAAIELTRYMVHKHYCDHDEEALIALFDDNIVWVGAGEGEHAAGIDEVAAIFRRFSGKVPRCLLSDERYEAVPVAPDACFCSGSMYVATDPSENIYLRVHQRITTVFRRIGEDVRCCHIHLSNSYVEMEKDELGFPEKMARYSYEYMRQCIDEQKKRLEAQMAELVSIYNTVPCSIVRLLRTAEGCRLLSFNRALAEMMALDEESIRGLCWERGYSGNVLPEDIPRLESSLSGLRQPGDSLAVDYRVTNHQGKLFFLTCVNTLISSDEKGQVIQRIAFDISQHKELESALTRMSFEDSLTGVFNRNKFSLDVMETRQEGEQARLGVACFDLNGLKEINDTQGHSVGDALICRTARHISREFAGKVYRIGGDEFVVVDRGVDEHAFRNAVTEVCNHMRADKISVAVGISWSAACCDTSRPGSTRPTSACTAQRRLSMKAGAADSSPVNSLGGRETPLLAREGVPFPPSPPSFPQRAFSGDMCSLYFLST